MQTRFTPEQLRDPALAEADAILRRCVHCGFCNATCPTFRITGDELDGPRGRIYLLKGLLEDGGTGGAAVVRHVDRCLSCLACMSTCPSGVDYMHLVDLGRARLARHLSRGALVNALRRLLAFLLPRAARLRGLFRAARAVLAPLPLPSRLAPLRDLVRHLPPGAYAPLAAHYPAAGVARGTVALLAGCVQQTLGDGINHATVRVLNRAGYHVDVLRNACCGAIALHLGETAAAVTQARENVSRWAGRAANWRAIVVNASGCGTMLKDYGHLLRDAPDLADMLAVVAPRVRDVCEFLAEDGNLALAAAGHLGCRIASHTPCSLRHGQRLAAPPRVLLREAGFDVVDAPDDGTCCGSAGTYNLLQPALAEALGRQKAACLEITGADIVATGNLGCAMQIARFSTLPVVHTVELLDWAGGGPRPKAIGAAQQKQHRPG